MINLPLFITVTTWDILDILLVAVLLYQLYKLIKGTVAINIFAGIFTFYLFWLLVKALNMELLSSILGQFIGVGVIALIIVFQQEIRRFLLLIGTKYNFNQSWRVENLFKVKTKTIREEYIQAISTACKNMSETKTGALIVLSKRSELYNFAQTGVLIKAKISSDLIENIFFKNSPLHDGGMIIAENKILAARCILPVTDSTTLPGTLGLRHRAGFGMTQETDAHVIVVSEETGNISYIMDGHIKVRISIEELEKFLNGDYSSFIINN